MLTDISFDPFLISQALTERNRTVSAWLSGQSGSTEDPQIKRYTDVIDAGGSKEEAEEAYWGTNKNML